MTRRYSLGPRRRPVRTVGSPPPTERYRLENDARSEILGEDGVTTTPLPAVSRRQDAHRGGQRSGSTYLRVLARAVTALLAAVVLATTGVLWWTVKHLGGGSFSTADGGANAPQNILLMGLDSRRDQDGNVLPSEVLDKLQAGDSSQGGYNTNTLILMHLPPPGHGPPKAFSIPRDNLVEIPGEGSGKIKETYGLAKSRTHQRLAEGGMTDHQRLERDGRQAGREATIQVVQDLTGVPVDHFAEVNLASFYHLTNALGGVEVCLNNPVQDDYSGADFIAGPQMLDGGQALSFVRQRHGLPRGDLDRTQRQQAFLASATAKLQESGTLFAPGRLAALFDAVEKNIAVDANLDAVELARRGQGFAAGEMDFETLPIEGFAQHNGQEVNIIRPDRIRTQVRDAFGYDQSGPEQPQLDAKEINVLNGTDRDGLAGRVAEGLHADGYPQADIGNTTASDRTVVTYAPEARTAAEQVNQALANEDAKLEVSSSLEPGQVQVLLGNDFDETSEEAPDTDTPAGTGPAAAGAGQAFPAAPEKPPARIRCVD